MNYFDDEEKIIKVLHLISLNRMCLVNSSVRLLMFFLSLYCKKGFRNWINNSSNTIEPPDYINDKKGYMLEIMRVDDYEQNNNHPNAVESRIYRKLKSTMKDHGTGLDDVEVLINPFGEKVSDNSIEFYHSNFSRIITKHSVRIEEYRRRHSGYYLGFLIFDESPLYIEIENKIDYKLKQGMHIGPARLFQAPLDRRFIEILLQTDVDFVIWMTPNKTIPGNQSITKEVYLFDVQKAKKKPIKVIEYKPDNIICLEVE